MNASDEAKRLAILLHEKMCYANHTDGCAWEYRKADKEQTWKQNPHLKYLEKATGILVWVNFEIAAKIVEAL